MQPALIVLLCVAGAVVYGVLHDQVTARVCVEYFTIGHDPNVIPTDDPTLLGLGWGILATWWVGLILGLALAVAARAGRRPKRSARSLVRPLIYLLVIMGFLAAVSGTAGYMLAKSHAITLPGPLAEAVPPAKHAGFLACFFAHTASYWVGFVGGGIQIAVVWASRKWLRPEKPRQTR
ncbi:hypothetical protein [Fimbriiglobus ruber]|uniref:Uncharacterized protein n=1 Tax=Fimbriiglobus ruber TaxID=1908690 RepID=A0A225DMZ0_9BACT|nr:hypothetical protein [Fimbriiglobus ruber]OWK37557.1 hypothetical protein FRUB_06677 [Fimbriiglobus ruber]